LFSKQSDFYQWFDCRTTGIVCFKANFFDQKKACSCWTVQMRCGGFHRRFVWMNFLVKTAWQIHIWHDISVSRRPCSHLALPNSMFDGCAEQANLAHGRSILNMENRKCRITRSWDAWDVKMIDRGDGQLHWIAIQSNVIHLNRVNDRSTHRQCGSHSATLVKYECLRISVWLFKKHWAINLDNDLNLTANIYRRTKCFLSR
jgi:hypothetical protein